MPIAREVALGWLDAWEDQQRHHALARQERYAALGDAIAAVGDALDRPPRVVDLAAGPGCLARRLERLGVAADLVLVEAHPLLAELARAVAPQAAVVALDVATTRWVEAIGGVGSADVICAVTTLHYLPTPALQAVLTSAARALRAGGWLFDADHDAAPAPASGPTGMAACGSLRDGMRTAHRRRTGVAAATTWEGWWRAAAADDALAPLVALGAGCLAHAGTHERDVDEQAELLRGAGFVATGEIWRYGVSRILAARGAG